MGRSTLRLGVLSVLVATAHGWASPPPVTSAASEAAMTLSFFVLADWGGQAAPPYTNYNELGLADSMGRVSASFHPKFVVSAGGNFLPAGLNGPAFTNNNNIRVGATFNDVFTPESLQLPWYIAAGAPDWAGNVSAEIAYNGTVFTGGRWNMPGLYYTFSETAPGGDTIQIIVVDTMSLIGGLNPVPTELPPLYYPPPGPAFHRKFRRNLAQGGKLEPEPQADADAGRDAASFMRSAAAKAAVRRQATSASGEARRRAMAAAEGGGGGGQGVRAAGEGGKVWRSLKRAGRRLSQMAAMGPAVAATGTGMAAATATTATPAYGAAATATPAYSTAATSAYGAAATGAATGAATPAYGGVGATMGAGGINPWAPGGVGMSGGGTGMGTGVGTGLPPYNAAGAAAYASATAAAAAAGTTGVASGAAPTPAEIAIASAKAAAALKATTYDFVPSPPWAPVINYPTSPPPPVDEAQWEWIGTTLNTSTADWIVVVGYHPVWSAGSWGPTWPLVERLAPLLDSAGVALYLSGCDHLMQHFKPVPSWTNVDYVVVGAGAFSNANVTSATAMPHADDCPDDSLQFSYEATPGFVNVQIASANVKEPSTLHVNFFDSNQTMMYTFYKENPRTEAGHRDGDLASPPAPGFGGHDDDFNSEPLIIMGGAFLVVAVALCLFGAASHARRQLSYMSVIKGKGAGNTGKVVGVEESTPLIRGGTGRLATRAGAIGFVNSARGGGAAGGVTQRL